MTSKEDIAAAHQRLTKIQDAIADEGKGKIAYEMPPVAIPIPKAAGAARPGIKTTELWVTVLTILGVALPIILKTDLLDDTWKLAIAAAVATLACLGFTASRTLVKRSISAHEQHHEKVERKVVESGLPKSKKAYYVGVK